MQAFRDLRVIDAESNRSKLLIFLDTLRSEEVKGWLFLEEKAREYADNIYKDLREVAVFASPKICQRTATVWLILSGREVKITNIVPTETGSLSYDEYNAIFDKFYKELAAPAAKAAGVNLFSTPAEVHLEEVIGAETYEKLMIWEITCNSGSGIDHPMDFERWADFLTTAFTYKSKINAQLLQRWLIEDKGWQDHEVIERLGADFENGISLLDYYVNNR
jgi:hypothetical protein